MNDLGRSPDGSGYSAELEPEEVSAVPVSIPNAGLSGGAVDTLHCLFLNGPTWDGDLPSKCGRDELVKRKLAMRHDGHQTLTINGLKLALKLGLDRKKERRQRERRERNNNLAGAASRVRDEASLAVARMRSSLGYYDFLLPGDYVPDAPLRKDWLGRWRPAFVVTDQLVQWAGQIARARSLMDLKAASEAIRDEHRNRCTQCREPASVLGNGLCFKCAPKGQWPSFASGILTEGGDVEQGAMRSTRARCPKGRRPKAVVAAPLKKDQTR